MLRAYLGFGLAAIRMLRNNALKLLFLNESQHPVC
jgi:hypothetical protein